MSHILRAAFLSALVLSVSACEVGGEGFDDEQELDEQFDGVPEIGDEPVDENPDPELNVNFGNYQYIGYIGRYPTYTTTCSSGGCGGYQRAYRWNGGCREGLKRNVSLPRGGGINYLSGFYTTYVIDCR